MSIAKKPRARGRRPSSRSAASRGAPAASRSASAAKASGSSRKAARSPEKPRSAQPPAGAAGAVAAEAEAVGTVVARAAAPVAEASRTPARRAADVRATAVAAPKPAPASATRPVATTGNRAPSAPGAAERVARPSPAPTGRTCATSASRHAAPAATAPHRVVEARGAPTRPPPGTALTPGGLATPTAPGSCGIHPPANASRPPPPAVAPTVPRGVATSGGTAHAPDAPHLKVGDDVPAGARGPISRIDIARYCGAAGDFNPLSLDEFFARATGLPSVVVPTGLTLGLAQSVVSRWVSSKGRMLRLGAQARKLVWPGDVVTARARVADIRESPGGGRQIDLDVWVENQKGELVLRGQATCEVSPRTDDYAANAAALNALLPRR